VRFRDGFRALESIAIDTHSHLISDYGHQRTELGNNPKKKRVIIKLSKLTLKKAGV
jgi:hypothetical protein